MAHLKVRSPRLLAVSVGLFAASALLWSAGQPASPVTDVAVLASEDPGTRVDLDGTLAPFTVPNTGSWRAVHEHLENHTAKLVASDPDPSVFVLVTDDRFLGVGPAEIEGELVYRGPMPGDSSRTVVVVRA